MHKKSAGMYSKPWTEAIVEEVVCEVPGREFHFLF